MTDHTSPVAAELENAVASESWDRVEELWLEALDETPIPTAALLEVRRRLWQAGKKALALTLLELLVESLESRESHRDTLAAVRELVRLTDKPQPELKARLETAVRRARQGSPSLDAVLERYRLTDSRRPIETLEAIETWLDHDVGSVVEVSGQGVGRVVELNLELENVKVDLGGSRPVSVPFGAVARFLQRLADGDFRRRKVESPEELQRLVDEQPGEALAQLLSSLGEPSDVASIKTALGDLVGPAAWSSWWTKARKDPRIVTSGSGSRLRYAVSADSAAAADELLGQLRHAAPRDRLPVARRLAERGGDAAREAGALLSESLPALEHAEPGLAWETATLLGELPGGEAAAASCRHRLADEASPEILLAGIQDRSSRAEALEELRHAHPDAWASIWAAWMLHEEHPSVLDSIAMELDRRGAEAALDRSLETVFRSHLEHPAQLVWACEAMVRDDAPEALRLRRTPSLLEKLPDVLQKKEFASLRARGKALLDGGQVAVQLILRAASQQQAERFLGRVQRLDAVEPGRVRLLEQAVTQARGRDAAIEAQEPQLVATRGAVEARRAELKELLEREIPQTLKKINAAAAEGDLRENFEYHMLRDRQELLSAKAAKLQRELARVRVLEPGSAAATAVNIGTVVRFEALDGGDVAPLTILGPWDADPSRRVFADGSDLAQGLLGHEVGDEVELEGRRVRITGIEPWS